MLTKVCTKCKQEKNIKDFNKKGKYYHAYCRSCLYAYQMERWINRKIWAINLKENKCHRCGETFPYYVYDFHHTNPKNKLYDWNKMRLMSKKTLLEELDKCILVCANCHRIIEHESIH